MGALRVGGEGGRVGKGHVCGGVDVCVCVHVCVCMYVLACICACICVWGRGWGGIIAPPPRQWVKQNMYPLGGGEVV